MHYPGFTSRHGCITTCLPEFATLCSISLVLPALMWFLTTAFYLLTNIGAIILRGGTKGRRPDEKQKRHRPSSASLLSQAAMAPAAVAALHPHQQRFTMVN